MGLLGGAVMDLAVGCRVQGKRWGFLIPLSSCLNTVPAATQVAPMGSFDAKMGSEAGMCVAWPQSPLRARVAASGLESGPASAKSHTQLPRGRLHPALGAACWVLEKSGAFCPP